MIAFKEKFLTYNIVVDGDSIDLGDGSVSASWKNAMLANFPRKIYTHTNVSVSGQQLGGVAPNMISRSSPTAKYNSSYDKNILLMGGGTNDLCHILIDGWPVSHIFDDWQTYYNARIAEGWIVIPRTVLPRSQPACNNIVNFEADRQTYNTLIKNYCTTNGITICNCGDDATIGVAGASDNLTYYNADKVHLESAGATILANLYGTAVLTKM